MWEFLMISQYFTISNYQFLEDSSKNSKIYESDREINAWNVQWGRLRFHHQTTHKFFPHFSELIIHGEQQSIEIDDI